MNRRQFLAVSGATAAATALAQIPDGAPAISIDPAPLFELSPYLYMHFMEPLGVTDSSIEASWDHARNRWRPDLVALTKELAPAMMRWGGLYCSYYKWREGVGPRDKRKPLCNLVWGGVETNQIGTAEFVGFCRQVNSDPLMCVNFECEGHKPWMTDPLGSSRFADAKEAAEWVDYCNNPENKERKEHGHAQPLTIPYWQIGNETSYSNERFKQDQAIAKTIEFAQAMRGADKKIKLIGWGDSGWMKNIIERAGEHLDYIAFHDLFDPARPDPKSPLKNSDWRKDAAATWDAFMNGYKIHERKVVEMRQQAEGKKPLALTECHYAPQGRNRCEMQSTWACGVSYARFLNLHERHGDVLKIANISDFCGTRWQTNAVMLPVPNGRAYAMPIARVMQLYRLHSGKNFVKVTGTPPELDVTASRTGSTIYLHVINTNRTQSRQASLAIAGLTPKSAKAFTIATDPEFEIMSAERDPMKIRESVVDMGKPVEFAAASVTALEVATDGQA